MGDIHAMGNIFQVILFFSEAINEDTLFLVLIDNCTYTNLYLVIFTCKVVVMCCMYSWEKNKTELVYSVNLLCPKLYYFILLACDNPSGVLKLTFGLLYYHLNKEIKK